MVGETAGSAGGPVGGRPASNDRGMGAFVEGAGDVMSEVLRVTIVSRDGGSGDGGWLSR